MSFSFVGRMYSSIKGFYNEINSATLTGAIDVVIVKQPDGSYHSSPFHVRFGKLGVLRAREKIVDIEINGQPVGLQMKLGEAGEAFFVQEFSDDEEEVEFPAYLATSPIESGDELMAEGLAQLKAEAEKQLQQRLQQHRETIDEEHDLHLESPGGSQLPQQQHLTEDTVAMTLDLSSLTKDLKSDSSYEEDKQKGKPRRKKYKKRKQKHAGPPRSSPRSQSMPEGLGLDPIFDMEVTESTSEDEEMAGYSLGASRSMSLDMKKVDSQGILSEELPLMDRRISSVDALMTPFSDPELSPPQSPLPTRPPSPKSDTEVDRQHTEESQQLLLQEAAPTWDWGQFPKQTPLSSPDRESSHKELIDNALERQDSEKVTSGGLLSLLSRQKSQKKSQVSGTPKKAVGVEEKGMYLDDLASLEDPEIAKLYLGSPRFQSIRDREREDDSESGRGASLPQSPHSVDGAIGGTVSFLESEVRHLGPVALSLCGGLSNPEGITLDKFMKKVMTFDDLVEQPSIITNPDLVVKIRDGYFNWATAAPMVLCEMAFNKRMPETAVSSLVKKNMPKKILKKKTSGLSWWSWRSSTNQNAEGGAENVAIPSSSTALSVVIPVGGAQVTSDQEAMSSKVSESSLSPVVSPATSPPTSVHGTPQKFKIDRRSLLDPQGADTDTDNSEKESAAIPLATSCPASLPPTTLPSQPLAPTIVSTSITVPTPTPSTPIAVPTPAASTSQTSTPSVSHTGSPASSQTTPTFPSQATPGSEATPPSGSPQTGDEVGVGVREEGERSRLVENVRINLGHGRDKFFKTLRLTSEQVSKLNLREGQNEISFSVTTQYQGTSRCVSHIYLWNHDDKIVISDIDGTITKSDVMGQILPLIGRDWSQSGVAQLFTRLSNNGYKLLYLSARAIGQSRLTKDLLKSIKQGDRVLPDGPLLLNPTSLISAFHREVIVKNPEEFKIHCLKDIADLFPASPFYAGFGNKINDVIAYRALQIPSFRIFTINPQGQLRHEFSHTFVSSYTKMSDVADHFFPPINTMNRTTSNEFSAVNYWRTPPPAIETVDLNGLATSEEDSNKSSSPPTTTSLSRGTPPTTTTSPNKTTPPMTSTTAVITVATHPDTTTTTTTTIITAVEGTPTDEEDIAKSSS